LSDRSRLTDKKEAIQTPERMPTRFENEISRGPGGRMLGSDGGGSSGWRSSWGIDMTGRDGGSRRTRRAVITSKARGEDVGACT
jgi:hypothetical protein